MGFFGLQIKAKSSTPARAGGPTNRFKDIPIRTQGKTLYKGGCSVCPLNKENGSDYTPKMDAVGHKDPLIYFLGEFPSKADDEAGEPFAGDSGDTVKVGLPNTLAKKARWSNIVQCRTPGGRLPTDVEIACCSQRTERDLEKSQPLIVVGFGMAPLKWACDETDIANWRGDLIPIRVGSWEGWYAPLWRPAWVVGMRLDKKLGKSVERTFKRDLTKVYDLLLEREVPEPRIPQGEELDAGLDWTTVWKVGHVEAALDRLRNAKDQSIDIETNGLRPYKKDSKILSVAFGTWDYSYAIPIDHSESQWTDRQRKQVWELIAKHVRRRNTYWAHHLKFELEWLGMEWALGRSSLFEVQWGDTMAQAHVLSSKSLSGLSLNARCKALFGVPEKTLDALDRANLDKAPIAKVLRYNARDTKFTDLVRQFQTPLIEEQDLLPAYRLIVNRVPALTIAQQNGVVPNTAFAVTKHKELQTEIQSIEKKIQLLPAVKSLVMEQGKPFNSGSSQQLVTLLKDRLGLEEGWRIDNGVKKYSTDEKVLSSISHPIGKLILQQRGLQKLDGTYVLGSCPRGAEPGSGKLIWDDGLIHTIYNYLKTLTGRLSSEDPNLQNYPKREHKEIRNLIMALLGYLMVSIDYGQIEARVIAMASRCPVLFKALWERYDIHMAWTKIIAEAHPEVMVKYLKEASKDETKAYKLFRSDIKNQWTFPLFFGSPLGAVANAIGLPENRLKKQFDKFWEMFEAVKRWQEQTVAFYNKHGYVQTLTGRRRYEPLSHNEIINTPIQGTASDIVVDSMDQLAAEAWKRKRPQLAARMNIHDDLTFYLPEVSLEEDLDIIVPIMCQPRFDFVNVPITVEISIGKTWGDQEEVATVESTDYGYPKRTD